MKELHNFHMITLKKTGGGTRFGIDAGTRVDRKVDRLGENIFRPWRCYMPLWDLKRLMCLQALEFGEAFLLMKNDKLTHFPNQCRNGVLLIPSLQFLFESPYFEHRWNTLRSTYESMIFLGWIFYGYLRFKLTKVVHGSQKNCHMAVFFCAMVDKSNLLSMFWRWWLMCMNTQCPHTRKSPY